MHFLLPVIVTAGAAIAWGLMPSARPVTPGPRASPAEVSTDLAAPVGSPVAAIVRDPARAGPPQAAQVSRGARTYRSLCAACHLPDGKGMAGIIPPLAGADYLLSDRERAIRTVLKGLGGPITVNGTVYRGVMPGLEQILTDAQVADVLTYVFNAWGNAGDAFDADRIGRMREAWRDEPAVTLSPVSGAPPE